MQYLAKQAKTRLAKEFIKLYESSQIPTKIPGLSMPDPAKMSLLDSYIGKILNSKVLSPEQLGAVKDSAGNFISKRTKQLLPSDYRAREMALLNEGVSGALKPAYDVAGSSTEGLYKTLTGSMGTTTNPTVANLAAQIRNARGNLTLMSGEGKAGLDTAASVLSSLHKDAIRQGVYRQFRNLPMGDARVNAYRVPDFMFGTAGYVPHPFRRGSIVMSKDVAKSNPTLWEATNQAVLEHELGHAYGEVGDAVNRYRLARRLTTELNKAYRNGFAKDTGLWTGQDLAARRGHLMQEAFATYVPQILRKSKSALRRDYNQRLYDYMNMFGGKAFAEASPELKQVLGHLRFNYNIR